MSDMTARMPTSGRRRWYALIRDGQYFTAGQDRQDIVQEAREQAARYPRSVIRAVEFDAASHEDPEQVAWRVGATEASYPAFWEHWGEPRERDATQPRSSSSHAGWITAVALAVVVAAVLAWFLLKKDNSPSTPSPSQSTSTSIQTSSTSTQSVAPSTVTSTQTPSTVTKTETESPAKTDTDTTETTEPAPTGSEASSP